MKYVLNDHFECQLTDNQKIGILRGFLEQEPTLFEFKNGFLFESYEDNCVEFMPWNILSLDLETLQRVLNNLFLSYYNQKDTLLKEQTYAILHKLYDQCIVNSVIREGVTKEQAGIIISEAYDRGHSAGYSEVISYCFDYIDFANRIIRTLKNEKTN